MDVALSADLDALRRRIEELERENQALARGAERAAATEQAHRLSETRFRALFEQFPISVQIFDPEGRTLAVNRAWQRLFGLPVKQLADFNPLQDPQLEPIREHLRRGFAGEVVTIPPHPFDPSPFDDPEPAAGRVKWLEVTVWPVRDGADTIREVIVAHRDVTEQREAELATEDQERQLREAQRIAHLGSWRWEVDSDRIAWSDEMARIYGLEPTGAPVAFDAFVTRVHPDDRATALDAVERARRDGQPFEFQHRVVRPDGAVRVLYSRGEVERDDEGAVRAMAGTGQDITDLREAEEALRTSEESYRTIFDLSSDAVFVHDIETGAILDANRKACALHDCTLAELKALGIRGISSGTPPFDAEHAQAYVQRAAAGEPQRFEWQVRRRDGEPVWVEVDLHRVRILGEDRVLANVRNIKDRKAAEAALQRAHDELERRVEVRTAELALAEYRFRAIVEASPVPIIFSHVRGGTVVFANERLEVLVGAEPGQLLGRKTPDFYYDPADRPAILDSLRERGVVRNAELRIKRFDGTPRWVSLSVQRIVFGGEPTLATALVDITERKEAEDALRERTQELEGIFRALPDLYFRMEANGTIVAYRAGRAFGLYAPPEAFLGQRVQDVLPAPVGSQVGEALAEVAQTGDLVYLEYTLPLGEERRDFEARLLPLDDGQVIAVVRDVTARKSAEAAVRASEESYRGLFDALTELVYIQDLEGRFLTVNEAVVRAYGYTREELVGQTPDFLGVPETVDPEAFAAVFARAVGGEPQRFEWWGRRKDGSTFPKEVVIKRSTYFGHDVIIAVARDITEQKEAEEALRESEEYFRRLIENGQDLIQLIDADGKTTYVSPSVERLTGFTPEEMVGSVAESGLHRDDLARTLDILARAVAEPGTTHTAEYRIRHKDGSWRVFEGYGRTFSPTSADEGVVVNARDITERKRFDEALRESEERFRSLIENAHDITCTIDTDGVMTYLSPSIQRNLGWEPEELVGQSAFALIHPDDVAGVIGALGAVAAAPGSTASAEYRFRHKDGSWRLLEGIGRTLSPTSVDEGLVVNIRDVTERKEVEEALRLQKTLLEAQGEASIDGILVVSPEGAMLSFNRRFVEMWEIPPEVVASGSDDAAIRAVLSQLHDPDTFTARVVHLYEHPDEESRDEILLRDGRVFDRYSAPVRSQEGDYYGRIWFFRDITERKRAEEALRASGERERLHAQRLEEELEVGRQIQLSFLPAELLRPSGWEVEARFQPALQVAGDFYDTFGLPIGRVGLIIADVCGKGVGAALFMALFRSLLRAHAERASASRTRMPHAAEAVLKEAVTATNQYIARVHRPSHRRKLGHTFASVFFGLLDPETGTLHYVNAGHEPPVLIGPSGPVARLTPTGPALGLIADASLAVETITIAPGETLLAYTDGVTEARNAAGGFFEEKRLLKLLDEPAPSAAHLLDRIEAAVHRFADGAPASDDVTLMAVRRGTG